MGSVHEELYARVLALFTQDNDATRGLNNSSSTAYCRGGMWRAGDPLRTAAWPWLEVRLGIDEDLHSKNGNVFICTVEIRVHGNRDKKYEGNGGDSILNTIAQRIREVYNDCPVEKGVNPSLYRISSFLRTGGGLLSVDGKDLVLTERFQVVVSDRDQVAFQIFTPGRKTFYRGGFSSEDRRFIVVDIPDIEAPVENAPHPGYTDRLSIVRSVTRSRVLNRFDAEYIVNYKTLDMSFFERQTRVEITTGFVEQKVPLYKRVESSTPNGTITSYIPIEFNFKRATFTRTMQTKLDLGKELDADVTIPFMNEAQADTNKIRYFEGVPYLFLGANMSYNTVTGIALVTAKFYTVGPVRAQPPESAQGVVYTIGLPALGYLEDYAVTPPVVEAGRTIGLPIIGVKPIDSIYEEGEFTWLS